MMATQPASGTSPEPELLGFTGTRNGLTPQQHKVLYAFLKATWLEKTEIHFHHGDCVGADAQAHAMAVELDFLITKHPPLTLLYSANCDVGGQPMLVMPRKDNLDRDDDIAISCETLIVCPKGMSEVRRSGTWYTYRRAKEYK
ncbi:MAG: hypothetical protein ACXABY_10705, partial [Candidatus Thorarchaeota archaeon]